MVSGDSLFFFLLPPDINQSFRMHPFCFHDDARRSGNVLPGPHLTRDQDRPTQHEVSGGDVRGALERSATIDAIDASEKDTSRFSWDIAVIRKQ